MAENERFKDDDEVASYYARLLRGLIEENKLTGDPLEELIREAFSGFLEGLRNVVIEQKVKIYKEAGLPPPPEIKSLI